MKKELAALREEVATLRREVADLRGSIYPPPQRYVPFPLPYTPYIPGVTSPNTCGGVAISSLTAAWGDDGAAG